jgi:hypothetical protein
MRKYALERDLQKAYSRLPRPLNARFLEAIDINPNGCWIWNKSLDSKGYGNCWCDGKMEHAHRVSWKIHHGVIPAGIWVLHHCDVRDCVNPMHLFLGTNDDNMRDMDVKGRRRSAVGEINGRSKLTEQAVRQIRAMHERGYSQAMMCRRFRVSASVMGRVVHHKSWKHVNE